MKFRALTLKRTFWGLFTTLFLVSCGSNRLTFSKVDFLKRKNPGQTEHVNSIETKVVLKKIDDSDPKRELEVVQSLPKLIKEVVAPSKNEPQIYSDLPFGRYVWEPVKIEPDSPVQNIESVVLVNDHPVDIEESKKVTTYVKKSMSRSEMGYFILAILFPFLAVGAISDWDLKISIISVVLMVALWIPAVIYSVL